MPTLLTIAGFDPSSGAGITADLAVFAAHGLFGTSAVTALTVQSTLGVASIHPVDPAILRDTLACLEADLPPDAIKIGMLATAGCVAVVAGYLEGLHRAGRRPTVVLDPVLRSSSGCALLDEQGTHLLRTRLLPLVDWVTPNLDELPILVARALQPNREDVLSAARALAAAYPNLTLLVTGGHMDPPDDLLVLSATSAVHLPGHLWLPGERVLTTSTHGTGCALSSALLCRLALGDAAPAAATSAKRYVAEALRRAIPVGHGHGPINLLWPALSSPSAA